MKIEHLKVNHIQTPMGYAIERPVFSYIVTESTGKKQISAQIRVALDETMEQLVYDSGKRKDISSLAFAPELPLQPRTRYYWNVACWADDGDSGVSETDWFETGKREEPWVGQWICAPFDPDVHPLFRRQFTLDQPVRCARLYIVGLGLYEAYINGRKVGEEYLTPYFTDYENIIQYQSFDVTALLQTGENVLGAMLANGWYRGRFGFGDKLARLFGGDMQLLAELVVELRDGTSRIIGTDERWLCHPSPVLDSNIYDGERYDARIAPADWAEPGCNGTDFVPAVLTDAPKGKLCERRSLPVVRMQSRDQWKLLHTPAGELVVDFGQVITGWVVFHNHLPAGSSVKLEFGELLQHENFYRDNLRTALAAYEYTSGGREELVRPHFTFYGFRYMRVQGMTEQELTASGLRAWVLYSRLDPTGELTTSNEKVNRLITNALWSQRGNFVDIPTDCPQRDERLGWTGDAEVFAPTACFQMDTAAFYSKYLYDMKLEQRKLGGSVPHVVPDILGLRERLHGRDVHEPGAEAPHGSCAWGDAATIIPWTLYEYYGDKTLLESQFENMRAWTDYIQNQDETRCGGNRLWSCGFHFADWLALDNPVPDSCLGGTEDCFIATAFYYYSAVLTAKAAAVLGHVDARAKYEKLAAEVKTAFQKEYFTQTGRLAVPTQTAHALALCFGLVPEQFRARTVRDLKARLEARQTHLDTGFVGTRYLCAALSENGLAEDAYTLLLNEDYPSWLYEVNMGATTIWERWNSVLPNGLVSDTGMNSMNHYSYGAVVGWMYATMAGLRPAEDAPGFKCAVIHPVPDKRFAYMRASYRSASGIYQVAWNYEGGAIRYEIEIPFDAEAEFTLPAPAGAVTLNGTPCSTLAAGAAIRLPCGVYEIVASE